MRPPVGEFQFVRTQALLFRLGVLCAAACLLSGCLAVGVATTAVGVTGAVVGTGVKATGAVVGAVIPGGSKKD
jgi:hypothetical protein